MKKITLVMVGCLFFAATSKAQEDSEPLKNKKGKIILPQKGDFALGFNAIPIFTFIGNTFNGNTFNNSMGNNKFASMFGQNTIFGKYFISNKNAIRIDFRVGVHTGNFKNDVVNDYANSPDSTVVDIARLTNQNYTLGAGYEWRLGKGRLQGVVGAEGVFTFASATKGKYEYGNAFSDGNAAPMSTTWNNFGNVLANGALGERITSMKGGNTWGLGARVFAGIEYFIAPKISLGAEFGWSAMYSQTGKGKSGFDSWDAVNNVVHHRDKTTSGSNRFDADTDNFNGALYLMFHFR
jgi:hypothetical protein